MAWAQELKDLVAGIKTSHRERASDLNHLREETASLLKTAGEDRKKSAKELHAAAMETIRAIKSRVKEIAGDTRNFLEKSESQRMTDFKTCMHDVKKTVQDVKKAVQEAKNTAKALLSDYTTERKEAHRSWVSLGDRGGHAVSHPHKPKTHRKHRK